jgi:hypothetical protein
MRLRTWIVVIIVWGVLLGWVRAMGSPGYAWVVASHSPLARGLCALTAFAVSRKFGPIIRRRGARIAVSGVLAVVLAATAYLVWSHDCAVNYIDLSPDKGFPYPDRWIIALNWWFHVRNPARPGWIKLHGEFPRVAWLLGTVILLLAAAAGLLLGLIGNGRGATEGIKREPSDRGAT